MTTVYYIRNKDNLVGFTKLSSHKEKNPRIFLGYKNSNGVIKKIGYNMRKFGTKYILTQVLFDIYYEIKICSVNFDYMEEQDIEFYKQLN